MEMRYKYFIITNKTNEVKTLKDLVLELGKELLENFRMDYEENIGSFEAMVKEAEGYDIKFPPGKREIIFGDHYGDVEG